MADGGVLMDKSLHWSNDKNDKKPQIRLPGQFLSSFGPKKPLAGAVDVTTSASQISQIGINESEKSESTAAVRAPNSLDSAAHYQEQIRFLQEEHSYTLQQLHNEVEILQRRCAELIEKLALAKQADGSFPATEDNETHSQLYLAKVEMLENELATTKSQLNHVMQLCERKDQKMMSLEQKIIAQEQRYRDVVKERGDKIRQLTADVKEKETMVVQLTTQLHQLRLKEAVEKQRHAAVVSSVVDAGGSMSPRLSPRNASRSLVAHPPETGAKPPHRRPFVTVVSMNAGSESKQQQQPRSPRLTHHPPPSSTALPPISSSATGSKIYKSPMLSRPRTASAVTSASASSASEYVTLVSPAGGNIEKPISAKIPTRSSFRRSRAATTASASSSSSTKKPELSN